MRAIARSSRLVSVSILASLLAVVAYVSFTAYANGAFAVVSTSTQTTKLSIDQAANTAIDILISEANSSQVLATNTADGTASQQSLDTTASETTVDAGAPLALPTPIQIPVIEPVDTTPYTLNNDATAALRQLGYSLDDLNAQGIHAIGHSGAIPRRCATGSSGGVYAQGMALKRDVTYVACPDGTSPLYDAYRPAGYRCTVIFNSRSSKSQAILAHEIGHCLHFAYGEYRAFDINYRTIREIDSDEISRLQMNELIAEDFMICRHGLDTDFGASSYYNRYNVPRPTTTQCGEINAIITQYLIK